MNYFSVVNMLKHFYYVLRAFGWLGLKSPLLKLSWLTKHDIDTIIRNIARDKKKPLLPEFWQQRFFISSNFYSERYVTYLLSYLGFS